MGKNPGLYKEFSSLLKKMKTTNIGKKIFEAAKFEDGGPRVKKVCEDFIANHFNIYYRMCEFAEKIKKSRKENNISTEVEKNKIEEADINSLFAFIYLTRINHKDFLGKMNVEDYLNAIEKESGSSNLKKFLEEFDFTEETLEFLRYQGCKYSDFDFLLANILS